VDRRKYVNAFLGVWLAVLAVDAFRPLVGAQRSIDDAIHPVLDAAGLRQYPWRLFADVPRVNLRFSATLEFPDGTTTRWDSPDWRDRNAASKFFVARWMNYYRNFNLFDDETFPQIASGLAAYLARTVPNPHGGTAPARAVSLFMTGAPIPDVHVRHVPPEPFAEFDTHPIPLLDWKAP
jgi:hypothetical protein